MPAPSQADAVSRLSQHRRTQKRLERLAWFLDNSIRIPGLRYRIGVDALLGLVPVLGDALGTALSSYVLIEGVRLGVPKATLLRMGFNVGLEALVGSVPLLGDLFDATWKANAKNVRLIEAHLDEPGSTRASSRAVVTGLGVALAGLVVALGVGGFFLLRGLWLALGG